MIKSVKAISRRSGTCVLAVSPPAPPWTLEESVHRIEALGQRIDGYIRFMCQLGALRNASVEVTGRAVTAFHDQMVIVEKQLGRIHNDFQLE